MFGIGKLYKVRDPGGMAFAVLDALPDEAVIAQLKQRQDDALAVLFRRYQRLVFTVAIRVVRDAGEAEDLTQNIFMEIYRSAAAYDPSRGSGRVWILKIAYHLSLNRRRHLTTRNFYGAEPIAEFDGMTPFLPSGSMAEIEKQRLVQQALDTLNATQKRVLELAYFEGLTLKEIADQTGETLGNVRHHYYRGLDKLRSKLAEAYRPDATFSAKEAFGAQA